jgi:exopolysaccharide biosynthesis protein
MPRLGTSPKAWNAARDAVGGAGLLLKQGRELTPADWKAEELGDAFTAGRHPRTVIGTDRSGAIWLVTVDGRNPLISLGMDFNELQRLARRLDLREALNLDGGGSTTMVVRGEVVNNPSDPTGPRPVTDAILVFSRRPRR